MNFTYSVSVDVERTEGKFASRDELGEQIQDAIVNADPGSLEGGEGGQYEVSNWEVEEELPVKPLKLTEEWQAQVRGVGRGKKWVTVTTPFPTRAALVGGADLVTQFPSDKFEWRFVSRKVSAWKAES